MNSASDTIPARPVLLAVGVTLAAGTLVVACAGWLLAGVRASTRAPAPVAPSIVGPSPALEANDRARHTLDQWAWIDRDRGVVAIPIDEAMALVADSP